MNASKFTPLLKSLIGDFDAPIATHMGILPVATAPPNPLDMPFYNAGVHMDGLTTTGPYRKDGTFEEQCKHQILIFPGGFLTTCNGLWSQMLTT